MLWLYPIVFVSGFLTVLSPCVLPILPIVLGSGIDGNKQRIYGTMLGLITSFTFFALLLSTIVSSLGIPADTLRLAAAVILTLFGVTLLFPSAWAVIQNKIEVWFHPPALKNDRQGFVGGLVTGGVLGLVWTPCIGPIIATVTTLASLQSFSLGLVGLMLTYAVGMALPLFAIAQGGAAVSARFGWYKRHQAVIRQLFGAVIVVTAVLIATGVERRFQSWVLDTLPSAVTNPVELFESRFDLEESLEAL